MNTEFKTLLGYIKRIRSRYLNALAAFKVYRRLNESIASNIIGWEKAKENVQVFNNYKYFFGIIKEATRCYLLIELAKFFDFSKKFMEQSLTVNEIIRYAKKNISKFTKRDFLSYHKGRRILPELFAQYKPLKLFDIEILESELTKNQNIIIKLKKYRDMYLAHDDINKTRPHINSREVEALLDIVKNTIGLLYSKLDFSANTYSNFEKKPINDLDRIIENLIR